MPKPDLEAAIQAVTTVAVLWVREPSDPAIGDALGRAFAALEIPTTAMGPASPGQDNHDCGPECPYTPGGTS